MGQDGSKAELGEGVQEDVRDIEAREGAKFSTHPQIMADPTILPAVKNSTQDETSIRNTLKRTRDERDGDEPEHDQRSAIRSPRNFAEPKTMSRSISPPNTQRPANDRYDHWSPRSKHARSDCNYSFQSVREQNGTDLFSRVSPRSPSPRRRPAAPARSVSGFSNGSPSSAHNRRGSESFDRPRFPQSSLKWTAPGLNRKLSANASAQSAPAPAVLESPASPVESTDSFLGRHKVNFKGITGVPTGPKATKRQPLTHLPSLESDVKRRPHIFISSQHLPSMHKTDRHLFGALRQFVNQKSDVLMDGDGYYILFDDTSDGRDRLNRCYEAKNNDLLFSQYPLVMSCRPYGEQRNDDIEDAEPAVQPQLSTHALVQLRGTSKHADPRPPLSEPPVPTQGLSNKITDPRRQDIQTPRATSVNVAPPVPVEAVPFRHSSPLRVPSRQDKDDSSSSISGFTGSDRSASKLTRCHVCKTAAISEREGLTQCSSCPRRYHRMCHKTPPIPQDLDQDHTWQCKRCIKLKVQPKSRLSTSAFASAASPAPSLGQSDEPPLKKRRLEDDAIPDAPEVEPEPVVDATPAYAGGFAAEVEDVTPDEHEPQDHSHLTDPVIDPTASQVEVVADKETSTKEVGVSMEDYNTPNESAPKESEQSEDKPKRLKLNFKRSKASQSSPAEKTTKEDDDTNQKLPDARNQLSSASPERERHKWKGGGADKDIIKAGMANFFSDKRRRDEESSAKKAEDDQVWEVPDSPEGRDCATNNKTLRSKADKNKSTNPQTKPSPTKLKLNPPKPGKESTSSLNAPSKSGPGRMRPSSGSATKCIKCNKMIAFNPTGSKHCLDCRKAASAATATASPPVETTSAEKDLGSAPSAADSILGGVRDLVKSTPPGIASAKSISTQAPIRSSTKTQHASQELQEGSRPTAACEKCKASHKRCNHHQSGAPLADDQAVSSDASSKDDLDFWNTKTAKDTKAIEKKAKLPSGDVRTSEEKSESQSQSQSQIKNAHEPFPAPSPVPDGPPKALQKSIKRQSHTKVATSEFDLGDGWNRPKNTYAKLIGMALCSAENNMLRASEIVQWVADNVPGYNKGEGNKWESGISATLSMGQDKDGQTKDGRSAIWRKIGGDSGDKKNSPCFYQLLPEKEQELLQWDAVLKQAVSPLKPRKGDGGGLQKKKRVNSSFPNEDPFLSKREEKVEEHSKEYHKGKLEPGSMTGRKDSVSTARKTSVVEEQLGKDDDSSPKDSGISDEHDLMAVDTSDEEPIAMTRRKGVARSSKQGELSGVQSNDNESNSVIGPHGVTDAVATDADAPAHPSVARTQHVGFTLKETATVAQLIKEDAENMEYPVKSFFEEFPEYQPAHQLDRAAKIAEIKARPTRKQRFGTKKPAPWSSFIPARLRQYDPKPRPPRKNRANAEDAIEYDEVKYFNSLEEMFEAPNNPLAFVQDKSIVYRDGTMRDGVLPRAKKIYQTGYAGA